MKTTIFLTVVLALSPFMVFGQDQKIVQPTEKKSTLTMDELVQQDHKLELAELADYHKKTETELVKYNGLVAVRNILTEKLKRAIKDGDETLVEVAVQDLVNNKADLLYAAKWIVAEYGGSMMQAAKSAYRFRLITEEDYTKHLVFFRQVKARTEEPAPAELVSLIGEARQKVPIYFKILKDAGRPMPVDEPKTIPSPKK